MSGHEWNQDDEHRRANFEHMLARMEQDWFERGLETAEASIERTDSGDLPMPNTAHPALEKYAKTVRGVRDRYDLQLPVIRGLAAKCGPEEFPISVAPEHLTLTLRKAAGPAPFIGDPRWQQGIYTWRIWTDDYGRHITTEAELLLRTTP